MLEWNVRNILARISLQYLLTFKKCSITVLFGARLFLSRSFKISQFNIFTNERLYGYGGVSIVVHHSLKVRPISIDVLVKKVF